MFDRRPAGDAVSEDGDSGAGVHAGARVLLKIGDPAERLTPLLPGGELRVLLPEGEEFRPAQDTFARAGAEVRRVRYLLEEETISAPAESPGKWPGHPEWRGQPGGDAVPTAVNQLCRLNQPYRAAHTTVTGTAAVAAKDAFDLMWEDHGPDAATSSVTVPAESIVPRELARYLPFRDLNPAQAQALPEIFAHERNLLVVAPTGAGKTVIGMAAALRALVQDRRKAAWLVPQRSLTDELDKELEAWRGHGLRVERLSGEHAVDTERIAAADLWVATTEKFEALCRTSAFRDALADVGCLVVDEIHLLGDPARGPTLETLLARVRDGGTKTRIVGLSATVSNAPEIANWLQAVPLRSAWRPTRLTWQLPTVPAHRDFAVTEAARIRLTAAITGMVTRDGGSVLVFCGSKRNVRRTALVIADSRGVDVSRARPDDLERLDRICREAGIGLHYAGWEHRRAAEREFRRRDIDVLVATTTVAAGVNLPARATIIQDTQVGLEPLDVATVQQMFGRAGRAGTGEDEGWAFLLVGENERAQWQARLVGGHTVRSHIHDSLAEQVLSEIVQDRITTLRDAEQWWLQTLAYHQGQRGLLPVRRAIGFLESAQMLSMSGAMSGAPERRGLVPTELGRLTARLMISPLVCADIRSVLASSPVPVSADEAEAVLTRVLATMVPKLSQARVSEDGRAAVARLLAGWNTPARPGGPEMPGGLGRGSQQGDLAWAALLAVARTPNSFHPVVRQIGGVPYPAMYPILEEAPRYFHWIASQGPYGTIHPCWAIAAADLELRTAWRTLRPPQGAGRLLRFCEQMATPAHAALAVPALWAAARSRGHTSPDWPSRSRPAGCHLDHTAYQALLRDRATRVTIDLGDDAVHATGPAGSVLAVWKGAAYATVPLTRGAAETPVPASPSGHPGAAVFTWRGDHRATGWLTAYSQTR
jgi:helicase